MSMLFFTDENLNQAGCITVLELIAAICSRVLSVVMFLVRPRADCGVARRPDLDPKARYEQPLD
jgi:hypothetical protein